MYYAKGEGVPKDDAEAVKWYRKAAEQGHSGGQHILRFAYKSLGDSSRKNGDDDEAVPHGR